MFDIKEKILESYKYLSDIYNENTEKFDLSYKKALEAYYLKPKQFSVNLKLADIYFKMGNYDKSLKHYKNSLEIKPGHLKSITGIADSQLMLKKFRKAIENYQLIENPSSLNILNLSVSHFLFDNIDMAINLNNQILETHNQKDKSFNSDITNNLSICHFFKESYNIFHDELLKINYENPTFESLFNLSAYYLYLNQIDKALDYIQKAEKINNRAWQINYIMGIICFKSELYNQSIAYFDLSYHNQPQLHVSYLYLAKIYKKMCRFEESIRYLEKLSSNQIMLFDYHFELAEIFQIQGKNTEAIFHYNESLKYSKINKKELFFLLVIRHLDIKNNLEIYFSDKDINKDDISKIYINLGKMYQKDDNLTSAIFNFNEYLKLNDDNSIRKNLSDLSKQNELKEAISDCGKLANKVFKNIKQHHKETKDKIINHLTSELEKQINNFSANQIEYTFKEFLNKILKSIKEEIEDDSKKLKTLVETKEKYLKDFTVSLFGRTRAGKSTIRETLTFNSTAQAYQWTDPNGLKKIPVFFGTGETIGKGGQRTTVEVYEYNWKGLRLIDTPGIDAYGGEEDTKKAEEVIGQSDIIICLATDDSIQQTELEKIKNIIDTNKKILFLVNVKYNVGNIEELSWVLKNPEEVFDYSSTEGHKHHIKKHIEINENDIHFIHAQAAFLSTNEDYNKYSAELFEFSRMDSVYNKILQEVKENGKQRRIETLYIDYIQYLESVKKRIESNISLIITQKDFYDNKKKDLQRLFDKFQKESDTAIDNAIIDSFYEFEQLLPAFIEQNISNNKVDELFKANLSATLKKNIDLVIEQQVNNLSEKLLQFSSDLSYDEKNSFVFDSKFKVNSLKGYLGTFGSVLKFGGLFATISVGVLEGIAIFGLINFWNPAGWVSFAIGAGTGLVGWIGSTLINKNKQNMSEERKKIINEITINMKKEHKTIKDKVTKQFKKDFIDKVKSQIDSSVDLYTNNLKSIEELLSSAIKNLNTLVTKLNKEQSELIKESNGVIKNYAKS